MLSRRSFVHHSLIAGAALAAARPHAVHAQDQDVLRFGSFVSPQSMTNSVSIPAFIEAVEEAGAGSLSVEHYPGGTLGPSPATQLQLVEDGVIDIAEVVASYTPGRFPELEMMELPFIFNNSREASLTAWRLYEQGLLTGFDNLELLGIIAVEPYTIHTSRPVPDMASLSGLKLRAGGSIHGEIIDRMGAVPVGGIPATQIAENISRRVLDGTLMDMGNMYNFRIADATSYHVANVQLGGVVVMFPMNKERYDSLSADARAALDQFRGVWFTDVLSTNIDRQIDDTAARLRAEDGHDVVEWPDGEVESLRAAMQGIEAPFDQPNDAGANVYQAMVEALEDVRAG